MASFRLYNDKKLTTLEFEKGNASLTRCANINYEDTFVPQANLATNPPFKVQLVSVGNLVIFSWDTINVTASGGDVQLLAFATKIPKEYIPNLVGASSEGQNFPVYINNSNLYLMWIDDQGNVQIGPTDTNTYVIQNNNPGFIWGSSIMWTTNNC